MTLDSAVNLNRLQEAGGGFGLHLPFEWPRWCGLGLFLCSRSLSPSLYKMDPPLQGGGGREDASSEFSPEAGSCSNH